MIQFLKSRTVMTTTKSGASDAPGRNRSWRIGTTLAALLLFGLSFSGQAQIALRGTRTTNSISSATSAMTINKPTGVVAGDVMIASVLQNETDNDNGGLGTVTSTGWTLVDARQIRSEGTGNGNNAWHGTVLYRVADGTEGSSFSFGLPNSRADMALGSIVAFSGVTGSGGVKADGSAGGPFDVAPGTLNLNNSSTSTATSVTTATANSAILMLSMVNNDRTHSGWAATNPSSLTEIFDDNTTSVDDGAIAAAWEIRSTAGSTGNGTVTLSASDYNGAMFLVLKSACPNPNTVAAASSTPTLCINSALTNITHSTTGATGIGTATGLPSGVSPSFASNTITISGTPTASGTFNYSIPLTGGCGSSLNATGTITVVAGVIDWANLQFPGTQTICAGSNFTAFGRIFEAGVTEAAGSNPVIAAQFGFNSSNTNPNTWAAGNWTAAAFNTQSGNNDEYSASFGSTLAAGTYFYAFRYSLNGCAWQYGGFSSGGGGFWNGTGNNSGVLTVSPSNTVAGASSTPTLCINTALTNITHTTTGATGIGTATGLPAGVSASWSSNTITISGTPTASGTFNYSIPLTGGCGSVNATGTITVTPANTITRTSAAGTDAQLNCINAAITNITYSTTGATGATFSGLPAGVSGNWASNVVTISGTPTAYGFFNYTVTLTGGCGTVTATGNINVNGLDYANLQFPGTQTICPGTNFTAYGQVFEPGITEAAGANANIVAQFGYHTSNTDPSTWPAGNWSATTYSTQSGNNDEYRIDFGSALASGTYFYTFRYRINGCSWQYGGAFSGFWDGTSNVNGVLTVSPANTAGTVSSNPTLCINTALTNITRTTTGATGIGTASGLPAGVSAAWAANVLTISGTPTAAGTFNYSIPLTGGCGSVNATGTITVTPNNTIARSSAVGTDAQTRCINTAITNITYTTTTATGATFSGLPAGVSGAWAANVATISGTPTASGTFNYTITLTGGCGSVTANGTITVSPANTAGTVSSNPTLCINTALTAITRTTTGATGIGTASGLPAGVSAAWAANVLTISGTPTAAGTFNYSIPLTGGCGSVNATGTITVTPANTAGTVSSNPTLCINTALTNITRTTTGATGIGTATGLPAGVSAAWAANVLTVSGTPTASGTFNYSIPLTGGCGSVNATGTITVTAANTITRTSSAGSIAQTVCENSAITNITYTTARATGATFSGLPAGVNGNWASNVVTISGTPTASGTFNFTVTLTGGCGNVTSTGTITVNALPSLSGTTPGSRCGTGSVQLGATSATGTVYWYDVASGGTSLGSGINFNTPSISASTTYFAEVVAASGCVTSSRTSVLATINAIPTVTATSAASRCGTGTVVLGATASAGTLNWYDASTGGTLLGTGTSFTTPSISASTNYFVEAVSGAGCISAARSMVTATVNTIPSITSTTPGSNCGTGTVSLAAAASAGTISWFAASTGGTALGTGTTFTTPSISSTTNYFVEVTNNGCTSARTMVTATISTTPSISSSLAGSRCGAGSVTMFATPSAGATLRWFTASTGGSPIATGNSYTVNLSATTTYFVQASVGTCLQPSRTAITANINPIPTISVTANYCSVPGFAVLTATAGMNSYQWNTGQTTQSINVDQAGVYSVIGATAAGCADTATFGVATELVANGSFDAGNTGFTTSYIYKADVAGVQDEMVAEGTYAVLPNPNNVHAAFYGADRHGDGGNIMVINGSPALGAAVWNQNSITVLPNTTYYFSAWAMSVVNDNNAILQFSINGSQVGTIAYLQNGYTNNAGPYTWVRFYGQWNSGSTTSANLSIVNLNQILGGNDFALDDISFGTMSPIALSSVPLVNSGTSACQGDPLVLNSEAVGGASPFSYAWTGPNGFTSTLENPQVTASASTTQNGTYNLTVTDGFGCTANSSVVVSVSALPANQTLSAALSSVCTGGSTSINLASSETGVYYQLRNDADNSTIGALVQGTGSAISLPTGVLNASTTFNVLATRFPSNCDVEMLGTVSVSLATTPVLVITNQAACSGTVNLTAAAVTAGSTGGGTLSYWTTLAATTAVATPTAVGSGTYFIRSTNGSCSDIQAVIVSISTNPTVTFNYSSASFCTTGSDPVPTLDGTAGVFTASPSGLVFMNSNTGEIDLSASAPGTYTVTNTVTPSGACAPKSASQTVTISAAPLAGFSYISNDLCQSANALNASPIFEAGAAAGTFSSSAGLSITAATGVINVSASTPGNYAVVNTRAASGGCPAFSDTTFLDINPYIFTGAVSASTSDEVICQNETVNMFSSASSYATVLLRERFNGSINNWIASNTSSGGTNPANAAWTLRQSPYNYNGNNHSSNDASQFYMSNAQAQGSATTNTILRSPVMSTVGFSTLNLDFFHYFNFQSAGDVARVQISTNNTTWTDIASFTSDQGSRTGFVNVSYNLNAYIGLPTVYIRFTYNASSGRSWSIDNVSVTGNSTNYNYAWTSSPSGYTSSLQNPSSLSPVSNTYFIATATNGYGCSNPASPVPVTVNPLPADNAGADQNICGSGSVSIGAAATSGNTYAWSPSTGLNDATAANPTATPGTTRTYTLTETITATGCSDTNKVVLTVTPLPTITSSTNAGRCGTGTVALSAVSSTGTLNWFSAAVGGTSIGSGSSFTTPSISATTTYFAEATSALCAAASRTAVIASVNAIPVISSQATPAATYSVNQVATALSVTASAGSGTISSYEWFSNASASNTGGTAIASSNAASYVPSTSVAGTLYYYCVVTNSNGCTRTSAVSGAITTIVSPSFSGVSATSPNIAGQANASGYKGQTITISGANFAANAQVSFNGVSASSVTVVNSGTITAVVNNAGASTTGNLTVTNPSTGAFASTPFSFIGYISNGNNFDWSSNAAWLGNAAPASGADVTIRHNGTIGAGVTASYNRIEIRSGAMLTMATSGSISVVDMVNNGTIQWTSTGTLNLSGTLMMSASGSFDPGAGTVVYNKAGDQLLVSGVADEIDFNNLELQGSGTKTLPAGVDLEMNNLAIGSGVTFNPGTTTSEILVNGNLSISGSIAGSNADFHFNGTTDQSIVSGATSVFSAIRVEKASGTLMLNNNVQILDSLTMTSGNINTQGHILEIGSSVGNKGVLAHTAGFIHGKVRRWYSGTNAEAASGLFPVGQLKAGNVWENRNVQLNYTSAPSLGGHLTVEFMPVSMNANVTGTQTTIDSSVAGGTGFNISTFAEEGYWKIDNQPGTLIDGAYSIALSAENFTSIGVDISMLTLVKRVSMGDWFAPGLHIPATGDVNTVTLRRSGMSGFSNFGFGIGEPNVPLPVDVSSMSVECGGLYPSFLWTTAQERDSKEFIVQQSADGKSWKELGTLNAAGNSDRILRYNFSLKNLNSQSAYVRIVLRNFDGSLQPFNPLAINCLQSGQKEVMSLYPNPNEGIFSIDLKNSSEGTMAVKVLNTMGVEVAQQLHNAARGKKIKMDLNGFASGIYQVLVGPEGEAPVQSFKMVIR